MRRTLQWISVILLILIAVVVLGCWGFAHLFFTQNNAAIAFYGEVIDQDGKGVAGATVRGTYLTRYLSGALKGYGSDRYPIEAVTDADGRFTISGIDGRSLMLDSITAAGYRRGATYEYFIGTYTYYNDSMPTYHPNPKRPEIFHLWHSNGGHERLLHTETVGCMLTDKVSTVSLFIFPKGAPITESCRSISGRDESADLIVTLYHTNPPDPKAIDGPASQYDWSIKYEAPRGGIIPTTEPYPYEAPAEGYLKEYVVAVKSNDSKWAPEKNVTLYLKMHDPPVYCSLQGRAVCFLRDGGGGTRFHCYMNPSGSRDLEP